jgi:hypothetical protein
MSRKYAANLTNRDKCYLNNISKIGFVTVDARGVRSAGSEGDKPLPVGRIKRLIFLGYLKPNNDGLFDGFPQTYSVRAPDQL